jgi:hypothetical protein
VTHAEAFLEATAGRVEDLLARVDALRVAAGLPC